MSWRDEWKAIAARIATTCSVTSRIDTASKLCTNLDGIPGDALKRQVVGILTEIESFAVRNRTTLPPEVLSAADRFLPTMNLANQPFQLNDTGSLLKVHVIPLRLFQAEVDYLLTDFSAITRHRSARAFLHLQRSVIADADNKAKWSQALKNGKEPACEKLGATHLLLHGIYAFKVNADGERTDLFFNDTPIVEEEIIEAADALILTEWKCIYQGDDYREKASEARA